MPDDDLPVLAFPSADAFDAWLREHHEDAPGVWVKVARKGSGVPTVTHAQALDSALCCGWIDGQRRSLDETFFLQRFVPRRPRGTWSKVNREHVARLRAEGRMLPAGEREVQRAQADGRWDAAYDAPSTATVPDDLRAALDASPAAAAAFAGLTAQERYGVLHGLMTARRVDTRARRIAQAVGRLERGEKLR